MTATSIAPTEKMDASKRGLPVTIITGLACHWLPFAVDTCTSQPMNNTTRLA